jgi:predicted dehydrogenase
VKIGIVGVGAMGRNHARVCSELEGVELVGIADFGAEARARVAKQLRVPAYESVEQLLSSAKPDAVIVATPTKTHHAIARAAIDGGAHVLVEKPIAATVAEGEDLAAAAKKNGVKLAVGHIERYNPAVRELTRQLRENAAGRLFKVIARRLGPFPPRIQDVGVIVDLATHDLNIMEHVVGARVERVFAETARRIHASHEDLVVATLRFANGTVGALEIDWLTPTKVRELWVVGERGTFVCNYLTQDLFFFENSTLSSSAETLMVMGVAEGKMIRFPIKRVEPLRAEIEDFVTAIRDGGEPQVSGREGLRALALALAVVRSGEQQQVLDAKDES